MGAWGSDTASQWEAWDRDGWSEDCWASDGDAPVPSWEENCEEDEEGFVEDPQDDDWGDWQQKQKLPLPLPPPPRKGGPGPYNASDRYTSTTKGKAGGKGDHHGDGKTKGKKAGTAKGKAGKGDGKHSKTVAIGSKDGPYGGKGCKGAGPKAKGTTPIGGGPAFGNTKGKGRGKVPDGSKGKPIGAATITRGPAPAWPPGSGRPSTPAFAQPLSDAAAPAAAPARKAKCVEEAWISGEEPKPYWLRMCFNPSWGKCAPHCFLCNRHFCEGHWSQPSHKSKVERLLDPERCKDLPTEDQCIEWENEEFEKEAQHNRELASAEVLTQVQPEDRVAVQALGGALMPPSMGGSEESFNALVADAIPDLYQRVLQIDSFLQHLSTWIHTAPDGEEPPQHADAASPRGQT